MEERVKNAFSPLYDFVMFPGIPVIYRNGNNHHELATVQGE